MNRMNLLDLNTDCLNIIGNIVKANNKDYRRTELINETYNKILNKTEPINTKDMKEHIRSILIVLLDVCSSDEVEDDVNKVIKKLREADYDLDEYDYYILRKNENRNYKKTELINEIYEDIIDEYNENTYDPDDIYEYIWFSLIDTNDYNDDGCLDKIYIYEIIKDIDKVINKLREVGYDITNKYADYINNKLIN